MQSTESNPNPMIVSLEGTFSSFSFPNAVFHVALIENRGIYYKKVKNQSSNTRELVAEFAEPNKYDLYEFVAVNDIIGCQCMRDPVPSQQQAPESDPVTIGAEAPVSDTAQNAPISRVAYFCIYSYPLRKQLFGKSMKRQRLSITFTVDFHDNFNENLQIALLWRDTIRCMLHGGAVRCSVPPMTTSDGGESSSNGAMQKIPCQVCSHQRKLLVFVNPRSGPGKALKIFQERVVPVLAEAGVAFDLVVTDKAQSAREQVREADLNQWSGIVIVSGDGLVYEVINGLMERSDWSSAIQVPIGVIPGGSGNGLAKAISHASKEPPKTNAKLLAAFNVAKGKVAPMDLVRVITPKAVLYSFLAIGWGIIADIDIESERLRALGGTRFTLWALARIFDLRLYRGRLSYLPVENYKKTTTTKMLNRAQSTETEAVQKDRKPRLLPSLSCPAKVTDNNEDDEDDGEDAESLGKNLELASIEERDENGSELTQYRSSNESTQVSNACALSVNSESLLPPLEDAVPENWIQSEDDYVLVYATFQTHISSDAFVSPDATLDDGIIWLIILRKGVTRPQLLSFMLALEAGTHVNLPFLEMIPVRAFRLEPLTEPGYLTVDGEVVDYGPIQAEVLNAVARIMTH